MGKREEPKACAGDVGVTPPEGVSASPADANAAEAKEEAVAKAAAKAAAALARREQNRLLRERFAEDPSSLTPAEQERAKELQRVLDKTQEAREAKKKALEELSTKDGKTNVESENTTSKSHNQQQQGGDRKRPESAEQKDSSEHVSKKHKRKLGEQASKEVGSGAAEPTDLSDVASKKQKREGREAKSTGGNALKATGGSEEAAGGSEEAAEKKWKEQAGPEKILENQLLRARFLKGSKSMSDADKERAQTLIARDERQQAKRQARRDAKAAKLLAKSRYKERRREHAMALGRTERPRGGGAVDKGKGKGKGGRGSSGESKGKGGRGSAGESKVEFSGRGRGRGR